MPSEPSVRYRTWTIAWVLGSSLIWAAVIVSTGDAGAPGSDYHLDIIVGNPVRHGSPNAIDMIRHNSLLS